MEKHSKKEIVVGGLAALGGMLWLAGKLAMSIPPGISYERFEAIFLGNLLPPFHFTATDKTAAFLIIALVIWLVMLANYLIRAGQYMHGKEHGSAKWGNIAKINKELAAPEADQNVILSRKARVALDTRKIGNVNTLVIGGSGSGKTRFWIKPNMMQLNASYFVVDPAGELLRDLGGMFERAGYVIKVINTVNMEQSNRYNPLAYIDTEQDALSLINNLMNSTRDKDSSKGDQFWEDMATLLLQALVLLLWSEAPSYEQNFPMIMRIMDMLDVKESDMEAKNPVDYLFEDLLKEQPGHIAGRMYFAFRNKCPGKTALSVLATVNSKLKSMYLSPVLRFFSDDELELDKFGTQKTIIFAIISDADSSFNYIVSILYNQLFTYLYRQADTVHGGKLPIPCRLLLDEFANCSIPNEFTNKLTTCRKRNMTITTVVQAMSQLKKIFKDDWETVQGTCGIRVYLGGEEQSTHESIAKQAGKTTINYDTYGKSDKSLSTNINITGRELIMQDEVRRLPKDKCMVFIQYQDPIYDKKYNLLKHPRIKMTADGGAPPYEFKRKEPADIYFDKDGRKRVG